MAKPNLLSDFLGKCDVCGRVLSTYLALAGHLRQNTDPPHAELKLRWQTWRDTYRRELWCRKCGQPWEVQDPTESNSKRCSSCEQLRQSLSKRAYEAIPTIAPKRVKPKTQIVWAVGDALYDDIVLSLEKGEPLLKMSHRLGVTYKVISKIGAQALTKGGLKALMHARMVKTILNNIQKGVKHPNNLEAKLASQLEAAGINELKFNQWQHVPINDTKVPREADIKLAVGDGRKVVVLCDGEVFHGPGTIFGVPEDKIEADRQTALGFFALGYSVLRYAESEIHDGRAFNHVLHVLDRLRSCQKVYRNWCPAEEIVV